jgi:hypothetical protein
MVAWDWGRSIEAEADIGRLNSVLEQLDWEAALDTAVLGR